MVPLHLIELNNLSMLSWVLYYCLIRHMSVTCLFTVCLRSAITACWCLMAKCHRFSKYEGGYGADLKNIVAIFCKLDDKMMISLPFTISVSLFSFSGTRLLFQYLYFLFISMRTFLFNSIIWCLTTL